MSKYTIYHNPRCTKSREALALLKQHSIELEVVLYLESQPNAEEIRGLLSKLKMSASQLIRKNEAIYKEKFRGKTMSEEEWIEAMVLYPKLIERPIIIKGRKAVVGRPPERLEELL